MRYLFLPIRMAKRKEGEKGRRKGGREGGVGECGEIRTLVLCWWECTWCSLCVKQ
jgi:hypothetical protein